MLVCRCRDDGVRFCTTFAARQDLYRLVCRRHDARPHFSSSAVRHQGTLLRAVCLPLGAFLHSRAELCVCSIASLLHICLQDKRETHASVFKIGNASVMCNVSAWRVPP